MARDAALARIGRTRAALLVVAVVLTALLSALASALLPGKSLGATKRHAPTVRTVRSPSSTSSAVAPRLPAPAGAAQLGLSGPAQAPQSAPPVATQSSPPPTQSSPPAQSAPAQPAAPSSSGGGVVSGGS